MTVWVSTYYITGVGVGYKPLFLSSLKENVSRKVEWTIIEFDVFILHSWKLHLNF